MLLFYIINTFVFRYFFKKVSNFEIGLRFVELTRVTVFSHVLTVDDHFEGLCVVNPFQAAEAVSDRHNIKSLEVQVSGLACRVLLKDRVHYVEQLLHTLVQSKIFATFDQEIVVFFVATVNSQSLGTPDRSQNQDGLPQARDLNILTLDRFLVLVLVLARHFQVDL